MDQTDTKLDKLMATLPPMDLQKPDWADSIVSAITTTLHSESDSIRAHQLSTSNVQITHLMTALESQSQTLAEHTTRHRTHKTLLHSNHQESKTIAGSNTLLLTSTLEELAYI